MGNLMFYAVFLVTFMQFTFGAVRYSGVNRTFLCMYKGVFETSLVSVGEDGEPIYPYFDQETLENNISIYLESNITRYVKNYEVSIEYLDFDSNGICLEDHCSKVEVSIDADINLFFNYSRTLQFKVKEAVKNG